MSAAFTPGPWKATPCFVEEDTPLRKKGDPTGEWDVTYSDGETFSDENPWFVALVVDGAPGSTEANARLIAAAPDHALICWAMCVQDGRWEEWTPYDGSGEFVFAGLRYATKIDEFGCPKLTPALREAITRSQSVPA